MKFRFKTECPAMLVRLFACFTSILSMLAANQSVSAEELKASWTIDLSRFIDTIPAMDADKKTIYIGSWTGLVAIDTNGTPLWTFPTSSEIRSSPAVGLDGTVYFGGRDRNFYAVRDGKKLWSFSSRGWIDSSPAIGGEDRIVFGSWDSAIYCLNRQGEKVWKFQTGGPVSGSPVIGNENNVICGSHDGKLYCLTKTGETLWTFDASREIVSSPALNPDGSIVFSSVGGWLYVLEATGELKWKLHTGGITDSSPVVASDGSILIGVNNAVWRISANGERLWEWKMPHPMRMSVVALADNGLLVSVFQGPLRWLDSTGNERHTFPLWSGTSGNPLVDRLGNVYVSGLNNRFQRFEAGIPLADSSWPTPRGNFRNTGNLADSDSR